MLKQHDLALQIIADLDLFLVLVGGLVDRVVAFGSKKKWPLCRVVMATSQPASAESAGSLKAIT